MTFKRTHYSHIGSTTTSGAPRVRLVAYLSSDDGTKVAVIAYGDDVQDAIDRACRYAADFTDYQDDTWIADEWEAV